MREERVLERPTVADEGDLPVPSDSGLSQVALQGRERPPVGYRPWWQGPRPDVRACRPSFSGHQTGTSWHLHQVRGAQQAQVPAGGAACGNSTAVTPSFPASEWEKRDPTPVDNGA